MRRAFVGGGADIGRGFDVFQPMFEAFTSQRHCAEFGLQLQRDRVQPLEIVLQVRDGGFEVD